MGVDAGLFNIWKQRLPAFLTHIEADGGKSALSMS